MGIGRAQAALIALAVVLLLGTAAALRLATYDRFLPLLDYSDESNMFLLALNMRGDEVELADDYGAALTGDWLTGYPPLYPWLSVWGGRALERTTDRFLFPGDYIGAMRVLSVWANVLTVGGLFWLGWTLAARTGVYGALVAGLLAALPYAVAPQIIDVGNLAIPDALIPLACVIALLGAARAITQDAPLWLVWSLLGAVAAIYLKYSVLVGLWATGCGVVVLVRRRGLREMIPWLAVLAAVSALTAGYLLLGYGALGLENREADNFRETGLANLLSLTRNRVNFNTALRISTGIAPFWVALAAGAVAWPFVRREQRPALGWAVMLVPFAVGNVLLTSSVVFADQQFGGYGRVRFVFPAALALSAAWALAVLVAARWAGARWRPLALVAGLTAALVVVVPAIRPNAAQIADYAKMDTTLALWRYTDSSLPNDGDILTPRFSRVHLTWNRPYSGYTGKTFGWAYDDTPYTLDPQAAYAAGIHYFAFTEIDLVTRLDTPEMYAWLDQLYPLKEINPVGDLRGAVTRVYRMAPPAVETDVGFGERVRLVGYDLSATSVTAGEVLVFRPYWRATETPTANVSLSVQLTPADDTATVIAQVDGPPVSAARLPLTWDDPDENLIGAQAALTAPPGTPPGAYTLAVILYNFETGVRLPVGNDDRYEISLTVE